MKWWRYRIPKSTQNMKKFLTDQLHLNQFDYAASTAYYRSIASYIELKMTYGPLILEWEQCTKCANNALSAHSVCNQLSAPIHQLRLYHYALKNKPPFQCWLIF